MNQIENAILNYLKMQVQYSLLITGEWGIGKTYFIKEYILKKVETKDFTPVLISLAGVNNSNEVYQRIYTGIYPQLNSKISKVAGGVGKILLRSVISFARLGDLDKHIEDFNDVLNRKNFENILICFDDLERKGEISWEELIGLALSLLESETVKVIFIGNEKEISDKDEYQNFKEKVVGLNLEFNEKLETTALKIIEEKYSPPEYDSFSQFLNQEEVKKQIIEVFYKKKHQNLRTLTFFLEIFSRIFYDLLEFRKCNDSNKIKDELRELLIFSLAISIEFKLGKLSFSDRKSLEHSHSIKDVFPINNEEANYRLEFLKLYYNGHNHYFFFESIYNFITSGYLNVVKLDTELKERFKENNLPHVKVYGTLSWREFRKLSDVEFEENVSELIKYVKAGDYELVEYPGIYSYLRKFAEILNLNKDKLKKQVKYGMRQASRKHPYEEYLGEMLEPGPNQENDNELVELTEIAKTLNRKILKKDILIRKKELEKSLEHSIDDFLKEIEENYSSKAILNEISPHKFYSVIIRSENYQITNLITFLRYRFSKENFNSQFLLEEKSALISIGNFFVRKPKWRNKKTLKNYNLNVLSKVIETSIEALSGLDTKN